MQWPLHHKEGISVEIKLIVIASQTYASLLYMLRELCQKVSAVMKMPHSDPIMLKHIQMIHQYIFIINY